LPKNVVDFDSLSKKAKTQGMIKALALQANGPT
jgi:hypothetical protein